MAFVEVCRNLLEFMGCSHGATVCCFIGSAYIAISLLPIGHEFLLCSTAAEDVGAELLGFFLISFAVQAK